MLRPQTERADAVALAALRDAGLQVAEPLRHASSTNNLVFLSGENIVRINRGDNDRLLREAELCAVLPNLRWTPEVVASGSVDGATYLIVRRKRGSTLARWWSGMRASQRQDAVEQLAGCMRAIHFTEVPIGLAPLKKTPQLIGSPENPMLPVLHGLQQLRNNRYVDSATIDDLSGKVSSLAKVLDDFTASRVIHGDLTFENVLWDGSQITAILDFEWARGGPRDLDLDVLLRFVQWPHLHVDPAIAAQTMPSDYADVPRWMANAYPELFSPRHLRQRLALFAIAFELRATLNNPPNQKVEDLGPLHPYARLLDAAETGGPGARLVRSIVDNTAGRR